MHCPQCGLPVQVGWLNCPRCGGRLIDAAVAVTNNQPAAGGPELRWVNVGVVTLAVLVVIAVVAALTANDYGTHDRVKRARSALVSTKATLSATRADLATTKSSLTQADSALSTAQGQVRALRGELTSAEGALGAATSLISELKTCLNGVTTSLADDVSGAIAAAAAALESVNAVCQQATSGVNSLAGT